MKQALRFIEWDEAQTLLGQLADEADHTTYKNRIAAGAAIILHTGLTFNEVKKLTWIQAQDPELIFRALGKPESLSLSTHMDYQRYINKRFQNSGLENEGELVVPTNNPFFNRNLIRDDINSGTLRRTFAHRAFEMGGANYEMLLTLKMYFGHKSISRTVEMLDLDSKPELIKPLRIFV